MSDTTFPRRKLQQINRQIEALKEKREYYRRQLYDNLNQNRRTKENLKEDKEKK